MKHIHIAIFSAPGPTHVHPTLTIVATLLRRGYRVSYVTSASFADMVGKLGAEVLPCPRIEAPFTQNKNQAGRVEEQYASDIVDLAARTIRLVLPFYERNRPDLILYDLAAYAGLTVAEKLGVPTVRISPQFAFNEANVESSVIPGALRESVYKVSREADEFFSAQGISRHNMVFNMAEPSVYFYVPDFQLSDTPRASHFYAGRCAAERPCEGTWQSARTDDRPSILIAASTVYKQGTEYYRLCLQSLTRLRWHTVLAIGNNDPTALDPLPPHCEVVRHTPLVLVMPYVDLIICAAGMSTTMESMYHGLPMLMLTHGHAELEAYAQNIENLGLGTHLRKADFGPESMTGCIARMAADRSLRDRVQRMQAKVRRSAGGEEVVNWIEERLAHGQR
jgi:MGT family glycosyltransferase